MSKILLIKFNIQKKKKKKRNWSITKKKKKKKKYTQKKKKKKKLSQYDLKFELKINVGHCDLHFMVQ